LNGNGDSVVRVRRASDNDEKDFTAEQIELGEMVNWVNSQIVPPLDIGIETEDGRIPVPEGGTSIGTPAAAYSLRNLSTTYTGNVVDVRRSSDDAEESFTAEEVSDGTLEAWVNADVVTYTSDFSAGVGFWLNFSQGAVEGNIDGIGGLDDNLRYTQGIGQGILYNSVLFSLGSEYTISVDYYFPSSNTNTPTAIDFRFGGSDVIETVATPVEDTWNNWSVSGELSTSAQLQIRPANLATGDVFYVRNVVITQTTADGHVSKWYDQSGNTNHAVQTTPANQPTIVEGGSLVTGGIDFDGVDDRLNITSNISLSSDDFFFTSVLKVLDGDGQDITPIGNNTGNRFLISLNYDSDAAQMRADDGSFLTQPFTVSEPTGYILATVQRVSDSAKLFHQGSDTATFDATGKSFTLGNLGQRIPTTYSKHSIQEIIIYDSDQSDNRTAIEANIGETYGITGIPAYDNTVDGFVETWYDQSGNGNDATQSVTGSQPQIVASGSLVLDADGNPAIEFDSVNDYLDCGARVVELSQNAATAVAVSDLNNQAAGNAGYIAVEGDAVAPYSSNFILGGPLGDAVLWVNATKFGASTTGNQLLGFAWNGTDSFQAYLDGSTSGASGNATVNTETTNTVLGAAGDGTSGFSGRKLTEFISWKSDQTANLPSIFANINAHYNIYA
jgi:hypothetical protein